MLIRSGGQRLTLPQSSQNTEKIHNVSGLHEKSTLNLGMLTLVLKYEELSFEDVNFHYGKTTITHLSLQIQTRLGEKIDDQNSIEKITLVL